MRGVSQLVMYSVLEQLEDLHRQALALLATLAGGAAKDGDDELGQLVTDLAILFIAANHDANARSAPAIEMTACPECAHRNLDRVRERFGPWLSPADRKRLEFIEFEVRQIREHLDPDAECTMHEEDGEDH